MKYFSLLLILLIAGCKVLGSENFVDPNLVGNWNWESSTGGIAGITISSDSVDYNQELEILSTGEAYWYKDGELLQEYFVERGDFENYDYKFVMSPVNDSTQSFSTKIIVDRIRRDDIFLVEDCTDCFTHHFVEVEE